MNVDPTPHSAFHTPPSSNVPPAPSPEPPAPSAHSRRGRPRVLDKVKRGEICALVAGGCSLRQAARYVNCGINTLRRELQRNAEFAEQIQRLQAYNGFSPLRAIHQAVDTHWRAAAWLLERAYPERFGRRNPAALGPKQARCLLQEVLAIVGCEIRDPSQFARVQAPLRAAFEIAIQAACDPRRTNRELHKAKKLLDQMDGLELPQSPFVDTAPDRASRTNSSPRQVQSSDALPNQRNTLQFSHKIGARNPVAIAGAARIASEELHTPDSPHSAKVIQTSNKSTARNGSSATPAAPKDS